MKKIGYIVICCILSMYIFFTVPSFAVDTPIYYPTFDSNKGAFYANGIPIEISEDENGNTIITWDGGSINNLYVGGETTDPLVTGTIDNSDVNLIGGEVKTLEMEQVILLH